MPETVQPRYPRDLVPDPDPQTATAANWALHHLVRAQAFSGLSWELAGTDRYQEQANAIGHLINEYALSELYRHVPDEVAREIALDLDAGDVVGERIWVRLQEAGIDPASVRRFPTQAEHEAERAARAKSK